MKRFRKILLALLVVFVAMQFIRPKRNSNTQVLPTDISMQQPFAYSVKNILQVSCYDCHSNNTNYPWYANIEPIGWLLNYHVTNGKEKLNFSEFYTMGKRRQLSKIKSIADQLKDGTMPLPSYLKLHAYSKLSKQQTLQIINWTNQLSDTIKLK